MSYIAFISVWQLKLNDGMPALTSTLRPEEFAMLNTNVAEKFQKRKNSFLALLKANSTYKTYGFTKLDTVVVEMLLCIFCYYLVST